MFIVTSCCGFFRLRSGCLVIALIIAVLMILEIATDCISISLVVKELKTRQKENNTESTKFLQKLAKESVVQDSVAITLSLLTIVTCCCLIYGLLQNLWKFMVPFLGQLAIRIGHSIVHYLIFTSKNIEKSRYWKASFVGTCGVIVSLLFIYSFVCVFSMIYSIRLESQKDRNSLNELSLDNSTEQPSSSSSVLNEPVNKF